MDVGCGINCGDPRFQIDWTYESSQKGDGVILADEKSQGMSSEVQVIAYSSISIFPTQFNKFRRQLFHSIYVLQFII